MRQQTVLFGCLCVCAWTVMGNDAGCLAALHAADADQPKNDVHAAGSTRSAVLRAIPSPTLGGTQCWTDQYFFRDWRIQRRANSDEYRLLDPHDWQHANGTFADCRAKLEQIKRRRKLTPMRGQAVVLLHGLAAPRWSMSLLGRYLRKHGGYEIVNVEYASTRTSIDDHAQSLARVIDGLRGVDQISLVGHSMGNIVIRRYLAGGNDAVGGWRPDARIRRVVMIAPPNHGSITATRWSDKSLFKMVFGKSGRQLGVEWKTLEGRLATPTVEFGIIAGGRGNDRGFSFRLPGDDDGRIAVATTRLTGASDFVVVPMLHELIANDPRVLDYTLRFLQEGYFISPGQKQPIRQETVVSGTPPGRG